MLFKEKLISISRSKDSLLCVGLDTDIRKVPEFLKNTKDPIFEFNSRIIEATKDLVCAYKINLAFYESLGKYGWEILEKTLNIIPNDIIVIADAKRGDIGNTSALYARAFFETFNFDAITVNPFLGKDSIQPFLDYKEKGIFILTLTSNKGSRDFQYLDISGEPLYIKVARKILEWNEFDNCGLVVGATHPEELAAIRKIIPGCAFLIPGIGAQGGEIEQTIKSGCNDKGELALINISRAVIFASAEKDYADAAYKSALNYFNLINQFRRKYFNK